jgi:hypothetical protein
MAPKKHADATQAHFEPELRDARSEGDPMSELNLKPHLNGSGKMSLDIESASPLKNFLQTYGIIIGAIFGIVGSLVAAGFILKPATTNSVEDLRASFSNYVEKHDKLDFLRENYLKEHLQEITFSLKELLDRSRNTEIQTAKTDAKIEDVVRFLSASRSAMPLFTSPPSLPALPAPKATAPAPKASKGEPVTITEPN